MCFFFSLSRDSDSVKDEAECDARNMYIFYTRELMLVWILPAWGFLKGK